MKKIFLFFLLLVAANGCSKKQVFTETEMLIGTVVNLTALGDTPADVEQGFTAAFDEVKRIGALMGPYGDTSAVLKINEADAQVPVEVDAESFQIIKRSLEFSEISEGGFDITFASAGNLWDFKSSPFEIPTEEEIKDALQYVGFTQLSLDDAASSVTKAHSEVKIGLGGIAKGYIIDKSLEAMKASGIKSGIVDAGGDIRVFGKKNGELWVAGVRHPRKKDAVIFAVKLEDGQACATSGDYERVVMVDEKRYHHIIDPRSGYPTETFSSVTVIADNATDADAYATSFFVMGISHSIDYVASHDDVQVILIDRHLNVYASESLKKKIEILDKEFKIEWIESY